MYECLSFSFLTPEGKKIKKSPFDGFTGLPQFPTAPAPPAMAPAVPQLPGGGDLATLLPSLPR